MARSISGASSDRDVRRQVALFASREAVRIAWPGDVLCDSVGCDCSLCAVAHHASERWVLVEPGGRLQAVRRLSIPMLAEHVVRREVTPCETVGENAGKALAKLADRAESGWEPGDVHLGLLGDRCCSHMALPSAG